MLSRIKRIASRGSGATRDRDRPDREILLSQVRIGLNSLQAVQAELRLREDELLIDASSLYEQLKITAGDLADVRQQLEDASENALKLQSAAQQLEKRQSGQHEIDLGEHGRPEVLVVQPQD